MKQGGQSKTEKEYFESVPVPRAMARFAVPTVLSQLVTILYHLADTFFVGHTNDPNQVAALTLSFPIFMMVTCICNLAGIGANSLISRSLGRKEPDRAARAGVFGFYCAIILWAVWAAVLVIWMRPILYLVGASDATYAYTASYIRWTVIVGGLPAVCGLMIAHLIRAEGSTRQASIGLSMGGIVNIILDPVFVFTFKMGVAGAGAATALSTCVSLAYLLIVFRRSKSRSVLTLSPRLLGKCRDVVSEVLLVGLPAAMVILLGCIANAVQTHYMSPYGDLNVAAFGIVQKVGTIAIQLTVGMTQGIMPLISYNYAAGNRARTLEICRDSCLALGIFSVLCFAVSEAFPRPIITAFIAEEETVAVGVEFLRRWICCSPGMCFVNLFNSIFQAMGKWKQSTFISVFRQGLLLVPLLIILNKAMGLYGLVWSQPLSDTVALFVSTAVYASIMRKKDECGVS